MLRGKTASMMSSDSRRVGAAFRTFAKAGIAVFAFDAHGFGRSVFAAAAPLFVQSMEHFIDDVYSFREVISSNPSPLETPLEIQGIQDL